MANYKEKDELPSAAEFGQWRSRLAQRGIPQAWITEVFGAGNSRNRGVNDSNGRNGYLTRQTPTAQVNLHELNQFLLNQGWDVAGDQTRLRITDNGNEYTILRAWLMMCDYSSMTNGPLKTDLRAGMQAQGFCL